MHNKSCCRGEEEYIASAYVRLVDVSEVVKGEGL